MFGFSIQKLLVLAAIVGAVWYAFKFIGRLDQSRKAEARVRDGGKAGKGNKPAWWPGRNGGGARGAPDAPDAPDAEDMVQCPTCQAYVPARGAKACERPGCPYG